MERKRQYGLDAIREDERAWRGGLTINGIGLRESAFEILLEPLKVSGEVAVAVALMRWVGELQRAAMGGVLVLIGDNLEANKSQ